MIEGYKAKPEYAGIPDLPAKPCISAPTSESNWIIPKLLLVGAYPGHRNEKKAIVKTKAITDCGIEHFVCLMTDDELMKFRPYVTDPTIQVDKCFRAPIVDGFIEDDMVVLNYVKGICTQLNNGNTFYLHCWGGHGRTGTMVCLILNEIYGLNANEAMRYCQRSHNTRNHHGSYRSPDTLSQREQVVRLCC